MDISARMSRRKRAARNQQAGAKKQAGGGVENGVAKDGQKDAGGDPSVVEQDLQAEEGEDRVNGLNCQREGEGGGAENGEGPEGNLLYSVASQTVGILRELLLCAEGGKTSDESPPESDGSGSGENGSLCSPSDGDDPPNQAGLTNGTSSHEEEEEEPVNGGGGGEGAEEANGAASSGNSRRGSDGKEEEEDEKLDPVVDVCPKLEVKIADLGNACWVVSTCGNEIPQLFLENKANRILLCCRRTTTSPKTSRLASTAAWRFSLVLATALPPTSGLPPAWPLRWPRETISLSRTRAKTTPGTKTTWLTSLSWLGTSRGTLPSLESTPGSSSTKEVSFL